MGYNSKNGYSGEGTNYSKGSVNYTRRNFLTGLAAIVTLSGCDYLNNRISVGADYPPSQRDESETYDSPSQEHSAGSVTPVEPTPPEPPSQEPTGGHDVHQGGDGVTSR